MDGDIYVDEHLMKQHRFVVEESRCWTGLPAVHTFHLLITFDKIRKVKIQQRSLNTVEHLESYIRQEQVNIPLTAVQQLVSPIPRHLQTVAEKADATYN